MYGFNFGGRLRPAPFYMTTEIKNTKKTIRREGLVSEIIFYFENKYILILFLYFINCEVLFAGRKSSTSFTLYRRLTSQEKRLFFPTVLLFPTR